MKQQLIRAGCKNVNVCDDGVQALDYISTTSYDRSSTKKTPLSIVLLDIEMPRMDGITCIKRIPELQQLGDIVRHVPVMAITANARPQQLQTALEAGMDDIAASLC